MAMARTAADVLDTAVRALSPDTAANRLVPRIAAGTAPREVFATFALEQHRIIAADRLSYLHLTLRAADAPPVAAFFAALGEGENLALDNLSGLAAVCDLDEKAFQSYEPRPGCQAYPAFSAWLALNAEPADAVIALTANFAAWGGYCGTIARALRDRYGFPAEACAFFDFFAEPSPGLAELSRAAVQHGLDTGRATPETAHRHGRLLQAYELMFWTALDG
jgi:hypothetical protein